MADIKYALGILILFEALKSILLLFVCGYIREMCGDLSGVRNMLYKIKKYQKKKEVEE